MKKPFPLSYLIRKTACVCLAALTLLGLATPGCGSARESGGGERSAVVPEEFAHTALEEERFADGHADGHGAHGGRRRAHGPGQEHGHHGPGDQGPERGAQRLGEEVKDFALADNKGKMFRLGTLRRSGESQGKIAVLTFWCVTCHSCRGIDKELDEKARKYAAEGVLFLMVDSNFTDSARGVNRFLEKNHLSFPVLMDSESEIARYFGARVTTTTAVIDAEGRLRYYGGFGGAEAAVRNLMAGEPVAVPESRGAG